MKLKLLVAALLSFCAATAEAKHRLIFIDASSLTSGILPNDRLDKSSVTMLGPTPDLLDFNLNYGSFTMLGPTLEPSEINGTILQTQIEPSAFARPFEFIISSGPGLGGAFYGTSRTPFIAAIASATLYGGGTIFVKKGTYTIEGVVSSNIDWVVDEAAILRRANGNQMLRIKNGSWRGGTFITTAAIGTAITTAAVVLEDNSEFIDVKWPLAQDNRQNQDFAGVYGIIEATKAVNVSIFNLQMTSYTNYYNTSGSRNSAIGISVSTNVRISFSRINGGFGFSTGIQGLIKFRDSEVTITDNYLSCNNDPSIFGIDTAVEGLSRYRISDNTIHVNNSEAGIVDATTSSGSVINNNVFIANATGATGIRIQGGRYANDGSTNTATQVIGNQMLSGDRAPKGSSIFLTLVSDTRQAILNVNVVGNAISQIATFLNETGTVIATRLKSNSRNGLSVADQN